MNGRTEVQKKETLKKDLPGRAYQPSGISLTRTQTPLSGRAMEAIRELKRQDMNSYLYLLMEDVLFTTAEGLCREPGDMADVVAGYLEGFYKREINAENAINLTSAKT